MNWKWLTDDKRLDVLTLISNLLCCLKGNTSEKSVKKLYEESKLVKIFIDTICFYPLRDHTGPMLDNDNKRLFWHVHQSSSVMLSFLFNSTNSEYHYNCKKKYEETRLYYSSRYINATKKSCFGNLQRKYIIHFFT